MLIISQYNETMQVMEHFMWMEAMGFHCVAKAIARNHSIYPTGVYKGFVSINSWSCILRPQSQHTDQFGRAHHIHLVEEHRSTTFVPVDMSHRTPLNVLRYKTCPRWPTFVPGLRKPLSLHPPFPSEKSGIILSLRSIDHAPITTAMNNPGDSSQSMFVYCTKSVQEAC